MNWLSYSPYTALLLGIISLWVPGKTKNFWKVFLLLALLLGFFSVAVSLIGIAAGLLFYFLFMNTLLRDGIVFIGRLFLFSDSLLKSIRSQAFIRSG